MIRVSVVIPVEKENENLKRCLEALKKQSCKDFETIVVSDKFSGKPSAKRNWGAKKAKGEILAFIDDDCFPDKDWLKKAIPRLRSGFAICGPMLTPKDSPFLERAAGNLLESPMVMGGEVYRNCVGKEREVEDYPSANFLIRKKDFLKLGGFDERFWPGEDTKLCLEIVRHGGKILYDPFVVVYHRRRPLFRPFLKQVARYSRQRGRFARIFPLTSRKIGYFLPSLLVIFLMMCLVFWKWGIFLYLTGVVLEGARVGIREKNVLMGLVFVMGVIMTHVVYGVSFLRGLFL